MNIFERFGKPVHLKAKEELIQFVFQIVQSSANEGSELTTAEINLVTEYVSTLIIRAVEKDNFNGLFTDCKAYMDYTAYCRAVAIACTPHEETSPIYKGSHATITLGTTEALWLRTVMQNPLSEDEDSYTASLRERVFTSLLSSHIKVT